MRFRTSGIWISLLVWQIAGPTQPQLPADVTASPTLVRIDCLQSGCHDSLNQQAFLHPPSMQGDCTICHIPAGIPINLHEKGHGLQTARPDAALCGRCHTSISLDRPVVHEPVRELCTTCHNPHGGSARYFLTKDSTGDLCLSCHATVVENLPHLHGPVAMKECQQCHSPHTSDFTGLLSRRPDRLCVYCHFTGSRTSPRSR